MKKAFDKIGTVAMYVFLMIFINMIIVLVSVISIGFLAPPIIFIGFYAINCFMSEDSRFSFKTIKWKNMLVFTAICFVQFLIIYQYIKVFPYLTAASMNRFGLIALLILCVYFYIFNMYFMFLSTKDYTISKILYLAVLAPFHSIKRLIALIVIFISSTIVYLYIPSLILILGFSIVLALSNIILENYFVKLKG